MGSAPQRRGGSSAGCKPPPSSISLLVWLPRAGNAVSRRKARQGNSPQEKNKPQNKPLVSNPCRKQGAVLKSFGTFLHGPKPTQRTPSLMGPFVKGSPCWGRGGGLADGSQLYYSYYRQLQLHHCSSVLQLFGLSSVHCIKTDCPILHPETARAAAQLIAVSRQGVHRRGQ